MFGLFKKKTQLQKLIANDGIEHATERFAEIISRKLATREIARQFILEELDGASQGNEASQAFARSSGIPVCDYQGALQNSNPEIDGPEGPQQLLLALSIQLMPKQALMAEFRCKVDDKVMKRFKLGKYDTKYAQLASQLRELDRELESWRLSDDSVVPALHPDIPTLEGVAKRHVVRRDKNIAAAKELISTNTILAGEGSRGLVLKTLDVAPQDDGWKALLVEWAKLNKLPHRELITLEQQECVGFPSDEQSLTQLSNNSRFLRGSFWEADGSLEINLNFIPLSCLPKEFCRLIAVHVLYLHGCELKELPEEFGQLINLHELDLGNNKLTSLPDSLSSLSRLEELNLYGNNIKYLPGGIVHMSNLAKVNLSGNPELILSNDQKKWLSSFSEDSIFVDDDLFARTQQNSRTAQAAIVKSDRRPVASSDTANTSVQEPAAVDRALQKEAVPKKLSQLPPEARPKNLHDLRQHRATEASSSEDVLAEARQPTRVTISMEAMAKFRPLAASGEAEAQYYLGLMFHKARSVGQDYIEAARWYRLAAEQGFSLAQTNLSDLYFKGLGVEKNRGEAIRLSRLAADQGDVVAQYNLGVFHSVQDSLECNYEEALKWFRSSASTGYADAQYALGIMFQWGRGVAKDYQQAVSWYRLAASQGQVLAQHNLGVLHYEGDGVAQDLSEAFTWYRKASAQGNAASQTCLGAMYLEGRGVDRDYSEAARLFRLASEQQYADAQTSLGLLYSNGQGVPKNSFEALKWLQLAAAQGFARAEYNLGTIHFNGTGVPCDYAKAAEWYRRAAAQGHPEAQFNLALMYGSGHGVEINHEKAFDLFSSCANRGDARAQVQLGMMFYVGQGCEQDLTTAAHYFALAAEQGQPDAQRNLGVMFSKGDGVEQDIVEAERLFRLAIAQGNKAAQLNLNALLG